jgi:hypothetical protein
MRRTVCIWWAWLPGVRLVEKAVSHIDNFGGEFNRYIQSTCATSGEGLYEGLDWLSSNIANKVSSNLGFASLLHFVHYNVVCYFKPVYWFCVGSGNHLWIWTLGSCMILSLFWFFLWQSWFFAGVKVKTTRKQSSDWRPLQTVFQLPLFQLCSQYTSSLQRRHVFNWICCGFSYVLYALVSRTFLLYSNPVFGVLHSVIRLLQVLVQGCKLPGRFNV